MRRFEAAYAALVLSALLWGGTASAGKIALRALPPLTLAAIRFGLAGLGLLVLLASREGLRLRAVRLLMPFWFALGATGFLGNGASFFLGLRYGSAMQGSLIAPTMSTALTLVLAARFAGERVRPGRLIGAGVAALGVTLVIGGAGAHDLGGRPILGGLLFVGSASSWATYSILLARTHRGISPLAAATWGCLCGSLMLGVLAVATEPLPHLDALIGWAGVSILYLAFGATVVSYLGWAWGIHRVGPGRAGFFNYLVPVFGLVANWGLLGEGLSPLQALGAVVVFAGVALAQMGARPDLPKGS